MLPHPLSTQFSMCILPMCVLQGTKEAIKAQLKEDPEFRKELRSRVKEALIGKMEPKKASYNFESYMLTGRLGGEKAMG